MARVSDFFSLFKRICLKKSFLFEGGEGKAGLASVSEFVLEKNPNPKKKENFFFLLVFLRAGGGSWGGVEKEGGAE